MRNISQVTGILIIVRSQSVRSGDRQGRPVKQEDPFDGNGSATISEGNGSCADLDYVKLRDSLSGVGDREGTCFFERRLQGESDRILVNAPQLTARISDRIAISI